MNPRSGAATSHGQRQNVEYLEDRTPATLPKTAPEASTDEQPCLASRATATRHSLGEGVTVTEAWGENGGGRHSREY